MDLVRPSTSPYDNPYYKAWVEAGWCPAIHRSKAWCSKLAGHNGAHHSPGIKRADLAWYDDQNYRK